MNSETASLKEGVHEWVDNLSEAQLGAVSPVLQGIGALLAAVCNHGGSENAAVINPPAEPAGGDFAGLEGRLEQAIATEDVQALREQISSCLEFVRAERVRIGTLAAQRETQNQVKTGLALPKTSKITTEDATRGLPTRLIFERTVSNVLVEGKESVVALFVVERLAYINKRFGRLAGDEILLFVAQHLAQELPDAKSLCRWSGPGFAVLLTAQSATRKTEMQLRAIARKQLSHTIDSGGRSVMLPVSCSCQIEFINTETSTDALFQKMDEFMSAHVNE